MLHPTSRLMALACALCAAIACSKAHTASASTGGADSGAAVASDESDTVDAVPLDCSKVFTPADVAGILKAPAKVTNYTLRTRPCSFDTANEGGSINVYSGSDITNQLTWNDVSKSVNRAKYVPLAGVGDEALRNASDGTEVFARKGSVYCSVVLFGIGQSGTSGDFTATRGEELSKKMGALCSKIFAAS